MKAWDTIDGRSLERIGGLSLEDAERKYGAPPMSVHRVDLHNELLRLASTQEDFSHVQKVDIRLSSRVIAANTDAGSVELADGTVHFADLIVAADGVHSTIQTAVLGTEAPVASPRGLESFRFLIPTADMLDDPMLVDMLTKKSRGPTILADPLEVDCERHMVWYDCQE